ncbi:MAG: phosphoesterase PA-phosphatase [Parcubacteria group bacterium]|nr:phosphoesterase PA-phosphatase [Parcubacteria group bacterium]
MRRLPLAFTAVFGAAFIALVGFMQFDPDDFVRMDAFAASLTHPLQTLPWVEFFIAITTLGSVTGVVAIALLAAVLLRSREAFIRLALLLIGESASVELIKSSIHRIRPDALPWIGALHSYSFPSGHATSAMALFGFIAIMGARRLHARYERIGLILLCAFLILAIGASRIVLAAHYFSDVLAGYLLGAFWVSFVLFLPLPKRVARGTVD